MGNATRRRRAPRRRARTASTCAPRRRRPRWRRSLAAVEKDGLQLRRRAAPRRGRAPPQLEMQRSSSSRRRRVRRHAARGEAAAARANIYVRRAQRLRSARATTGRSAAALRRRRPPRALHDAAGRRQSRSIAAASGARVRQARERAGRRSALQHVCDAAAPPGDRGRAARLSWPTKTQLGILNVHASATVLSLVRLTAPATCSDARRSSRATLGAILEAHPRRDTSSRALRPTHVVLRRRAGGVRCSGCAPTSPRPTALACHRWARPTVLFSPFAASRRRRDAAASGRLVSKASRLGERAQRASAPPPTRRLGRGQHPVLEPDDAEAAAAPPTRSARAAQTGGRPPAAPPLTEDHRLRRPRRALPTRGAWPSHGHAVRSSPASCRCRAPSPSSEEAGARRRPTERRRRQSRAPPQRRRGARARFGGAQAQGCPDPTAASPPRGPRARPDPLAVRERRAACAPSGTRVRRRPSSSTSCSCSGATPPSSAARPKVTAVRPSSQSSAAGWCAAPSSRGTGGGAAMMSSAPRSVSVGVAASEPGHAETRRRATAPPRARVAPPRRRHSRRRAAQRVHRSARRPSRCRRQQCRRARGGGLRRHRNLRRRRRRAAPAAPRRRESHRVPSPTAAPAEQSLRAGASFAAARRARPRARPRLRRGRHGRGRPRGRPDATVSPPAASPASESSSSSSKPPRSIARLPRSRPAARWRSIGSGSPGSSTRGTTRKRRSTAAISGATEPLSSSAPVRSRHSSRSCNSTSVAASSPAPAATRAAARPAPAPSPSPSPSPTSSASGHEPTRWSCVQPPPTWTARETACARPRNRAPHRTSRGATAATPDARGTGGSCSVTSGASHPASTAAPSPPASSAVAAASKRSSHSRCVGGGAPSTATIRSAVPSAAHRASWLWRPPSASCPVRARVAVRQQLGRLEPHDWRGRRRERLDHLSLASSDRRHLRWHRRRSWRARAARTARGGARRPRRRPWRAPPSPAAPRTSRMGRAAAAASAHARTSSSWRCRTLAPPARAPRDDVSSTKGGSSRIAPSILRGLERRASHERCRCAETTASETVGRTLA